MAVKKYHLNASTLIWQHPTHPTKRPPLSTSMGGVRLKSEDSVEIKGEIQIKSDYFCLNSRNASGNCLGLYERSLGLRGEDPRGETWSSKIQDWAVARIGAYAEGYGVVFDVSCWGNHNGKEPAPFQSWWMGYFDNPTVLDPSMEPEHLLHLVESCLQVELASREEIAGVFLSNLNESGGPKVFYRSRRATDLVDDERAFKWACKLQKDKLKKDIFTNDSLAKYLFDKKRVEQGMKRIFDETTDDDLKVIVDHEVTPPENLEFRGFHRQYTGPDYKPHPYVIGAKHLEGPSSTIDTSIGCAHCNQPMEDHTYELAAMIAISGTTNTNDLKTFGEAIQKKAQEFGKEIAGIGLLDAETGKGADLEKQINDLKEKPDEGEMQQDGGVRKELPE